MVGGTRELHYMRLRVLLLWIGHFLHSILGILACTRTLVFAFRLVEGITDGKQQPLRRMPVALIHLAVSSVHQKVLSCAIEYVVGLPLEVCSPCPEFLQRTSAEAARPEAAEEIEADAEQDAKCETHGMTTDGIEPQSPVIEDETTDEALEQVVGQTHLADALKVRNGFLHAGLVVQEGDATDIKSHHGKIAPSGELYVQAHADTT